MLKGSDSGRASEHKAARKSLERVLQSLLTDVDLRRFTLKEPFQDWYNRKETKQTQAGIHIIEDPAEIGSVSRR